MGNLPDYYYCCSSAGRTVVKS